MQVGGRHASAVAVLVSLSSAVPAHDAGAQAHYWGDHFGNESVLLNGAVIGSVTDPGAAFYNPARLLHQTSPAFVASARLYEWNLIRIKDGLGDGMDLEQSRFGGAPGFFVGTFTLPFLENDYFAYAFLTRSRAGTSFYVRDERDGELFDFLAGDDTYIGHIEYGLNFSDDWVGLSWAREVADSWSVGASLFWYERSFRREASLDLYAINDALDAGTLAVERSYSVRDKGFVPKFGVAWRGGRFSAGASATLPYLSVSDKGSLRYENIGIGVPGAGGTTVENFLESASQSKLPVEWRTPWSVGVGVGWSSGPWQLHTAAEYFARVGRHTVLEAGPALGQSTGDPIQYTVLEERKPVLNGGGGVRWTSRGSMSLFASVVTNFSAAPDSVVEFTELRPVVDHTSDQMNFLLFGGGVSVSTRWADLTLGATWQASSQPTTRLAGFPGDPANGAGDFATLKYDQWRFLVGLSIPLVEERLGSLSGS